MSSDKTINRRYFINPYNPNWVNEFNKIKEDILSVFGNKILDIEHVGSTSVPGMNAKNYIDVLVLVDKMLPFIDEKKNGSPWI